MIRCLFSLMILAACACAPVAARVWSAHSLPRPALVMPDVSAPAGLATRHAPLSVPPPTLADVRRLRSHPRQRVDSHHTRQ